MSRISHPSYRLFSSPIEATANANAGNLTNGYRDSQAARERNIPPGTVALRWTHEPDIGLSRQAFRVWRHREKFKSRSLLPRGRELDGDLRVNSSNGEVCYARISIDLAPGDSVTVTPLGREGIKIPGAEQSLSASGQLRFAQPFITAFDLSGRGTVQAFDVYLQAELINSPDWKLIQTVGLPFETGSLSPDHYDTSPQGGEGALVDPRQFALARLTAAAYLHPPLPGSSGGPATVPAWEAPPPAPFLDRLENRNGGLLQHIRDCLEGTDDHANDPAARQLAFISELEVEGLRQDGYAGDVQAGKARVPVVATTLLSALMDHYVGVALGFGTYDFNPDAANRSDLDFYMVTNKFTLKPKRVRLNYSEEVEYAALAEPRPQPRPPRVTEVVGTHRNRPLARDAGTTEAVQLSLAAPDFPTAYAFLRQEGDAVRILNRDRELGNPSYQPHIARIPDPENAVGAEIPCVFNNLPLPLAGTTTTRFAVAACDIFGRWAGYGMADYTARALTPQPPGLLAVRIKPVDPEPGPATTNVACTLEIDCSWDWTERSPAEIEFGGAFIPADFRDELPQFKSGLGRNATNTGAKISLRFTDIDTFSLVGAGGSVVQLEVGTDPNLRRYRITVEGIMASFPGPLLRPAPGTNLSLVGYAVTARALEKVRRDLGVYEWSEWGESVSNVLADPRPPARVEIPAEISWTSLPDAANRARGTLSWPAVDRAAGYVVWQTSESALRETLGIPLRPDAPLVERATELRDALASPAVERDSLRAFVRLNPTLLHTTNTQVELPGDASVLYLYRVSAMTSANLAGERSGCAFFAVPRLRVPGTPLLRARARRRGTTGIEVEALDGAGLAPAGFRLYRVRKRIASNVVTQKGLPIYREGDPAWSDHQLPGPDRRPLSGKKLLDPVAAPSWRPYYYQAVAVGPEDRPNGIYPGISIGSPTVEVYFPPDGPPLLNLVSVLRHPNVLVLRLRTDVPFDAVNGQAATLEISRVEVDADGVSTVRRVTTSSLDLLPRPSKVLAVTAPAPAPPQDAPTLSAFPDPGEMYLRCHASWTNVLLRLTDPLGRSTERFIDLS